MERKLWERYFIKKRPPASVTVTLLLGQIGMLIEDAMHQLYGKAGSPKPDPKKWFFREPETPEEINARRLRELLARTRQNANLKLDKEGAF